ncbi:hypothetical protein B0H14DRAFT_3032809, partial [Mycena olivaceomarginata]
KPVDSDKVSQRQNSMEDGHNKNESQSACQDVSPLTSDTQEKGSQNAPKQGGRGGFGHGARITTALVDRKTLDNTMLPTMSAAKFCETYGFSKILKELVLNSGYERAADLLFAEDLSVGKFGFNVGQMAELHWALADMLLKEGTVSAVDVITEGKNRPDLIGGPRNHSCFRYLKCSQEDLEGVVELVSTAVQVVMVWALELL